ncbi:MAG TPA: sulfite exporter TauE/SafE family protein [Candidatus Dormibacteraeota bacterium]|nr:sulfite exporter TauE/SafE family protein [Candidatus Dormibacteraeota bacterium]
MTAWTWTGLAVLGALVGAFGTLVGAGGGFILTPVLLVLYPQDTPQTVTAISLVAVFFNAASGSAAYARLRRIDYRSGVVFALATLPGAVAGALVVQYAARRVFDPIMGALLLCLAALAIRGPRHLHSVAGAGGVCRVITDRSGTTYRYRVPVLRGALLSVGVGFASSFLGIGGGVIHVPLLVSVLGFPAHVATATSHFVLANMAGVASITHTLAGSFAHGDGVRRAVALSAGVVVGAQLGARISSRASGALIQRLLAAALALLAVRLLV